MNSIALSLQYGPYGRLTGYFLSPHDCCSAGLCAGAGDVLGLRGSGKVSGLSLQSSGGSGPYH